MSKRVTVLMPVYNRERYLAETIDSILRQTAGDFEFLIVDDGSTDRSVDICRDYRDPRIKLIQNESNLGVVASLNRGLDLATGEYIARMDSDDISLPERLEKQIRYMDEHPEVGVCGTGISSFGALESPGAIPTSDPDDLQAWLVFANPLAGPTVMLRAEVLTRFGLRYDARYQTAEDYELLTRCAARARIANVPEILLRYRTHMAQMSTVQASVQIDAAKRIQHAQLGALGIQPSTYEEALHFSIPQKQRRPRRRYLDAVRSWLARLDAANRVTHHVPERAFTALLAKLLARVEAATAARDAGRDPASRVDPAERETGGGHRPNE